MWLFERECKPTKVLQHVAAALAVATGFSIAGCAPQQRLGMVVDPATGLQQGSIIERNIVIDASQFKNRKVKVNIRNTSGDSSFDLHQFRSRLEQAYASKGYMPVREGDFGILIDINVMYSGQVTRNHISEFGFLGAAGGGLAGAAISGGRAIETTAGVISGITLGTILGSYVTEDTYIVVADVNIGLMDIERGERETTIVFSASKKEERRERSGFKPFRDRVSTGIAVYSGGRNLPQYRIADSVRQRFLRILGDVI
ncbi:MAG: hypothetical protein IIA01_00115 [Proteobacteria bacterium]|nr:hypothetical protein [Pseudomonadota bacterium]